MRDESKPAVMLVLVLLWPVASASSNDQSPSGRHDPHIEEIIVTATKRETPLDRVPISMSVIGGAAIEETAVRNFRDYVASIPGFSWGENGGISDGKITVRGVTTDLLSEVREVTGVYVDEASVTNPGTIWIAQSSGNPYIVDVARVEALRGPQGTLFGASSMGGVLRIVTNRPDPTAVDGRAETRVSEMDHGGFGYEVNGMLNLPTGERSALRGVAFHRDQSGFIDNVGTRRSNSNSSETNGGRFEGLVEPSDRMQIVTTVHHQRSSADGLNISDVALDEYEHVSGINERLADEWTLYNAVITYDVTGMQILSSTSYLDRWWRSVGDVGGLSTLFGSTEPVSIAADSRQSVHEATEELRLMSTDAGRMSWLAGIFVSQRDLVLDQTFPSPGFDALSGNAAANAGLQDNLGVLRTKVDHRQFAAFGEVQFEFAPRWRVGVGERWYDFDEVGHGRQTGFIFGGPPSGGAANNLASRMNGNVPSFTLSWQPRPSELVYAIASKGFRPGGPNGAVPPACDDALAALGYSKAPHEYKSDTLWSYELGMRSELLAGRMRLSGAVYHIDWSEMQVQTFLSGCANPLMLNTGDVQNEGLEIEIQYRMTDNVDAAFNASYIDAHLADRWPAFDVRSGERLPGVPPFSVAGSLTWRFDVFPVVSEYLRADVRYVDGTKGGFVPVGTPRLSAPSYEVVDLRLAFEGAKWSASVFADNVFDDYGIVATVDDGGLFLGGDYYNLIQPRTVGLSLEVRM